MTLDEFSITVDRETACWIASRAIKIAIPFVCHPCDAGTHAVLTSSERYREWFEAAQLFANGPR